MFIRAIRFGRYELTFNLRAFSQIHLSVLQPKATTPATGEAKKTTSTSTASADAKKGRSAKIATKEQQQQLRDTLKIINEKMSAGVTTNNAGTNTDATEPDDDSDTEKLSPLLDKRQPTQASRISEKIAAQAPSTPTTQPITIEVRH